MPIIFFGFACALLTLYVVSMAFLADALVCWCIPPTPFDSVNVIAGMISIFILMAGAFYHMVRR